MAAIVTPPWELLPTVALEAIFRHLCDSQVVQLRLMCRQWNSAICHSPKLMDHFWPRFRGDQTVFLTTSLAEQLGMAETSTARFREAFIDAANVAPMAVSPLWARIGQSIRSIVVRCKSDEELSVAELLQMLRVLPNLRSLRLDVSKMKFDMEDGVKLDQLERLDITVCDGRLVELFSKICSNLKIFKYRGKDSDFSIFGVGLVRPDDVLPIIGANQNSLQKISLKKVSKNPGTWLKQIPAALQLRLKELTLDFGYFGDSVEKRVLLQLGKAFPAIETLKIIGADVDPKYLEDLRKNMKHLRTLKVCLKKKDTNQSKDLKAFLEKSPLLENLNVNFQGEGNAYNEKEYIDLRGLACPNLKKLTFTDFTYSEKLMANFFKSCSNVRHLALNGIFTFNMDSAMQIIIMHMKSLEFLQIFVVANPDNKEEIFSGYESYGVLPGVRTVGTNCFSIARCCPNAKIVYLRHDYRVQFPFEEDDNGILETLDELPKTEQLIVSYENSDTSVDINKDLRGIVALGKNLRYVKLVIKGINRTTKAARDAFTEALANVADVQIEIKA